MNYDKILSEMDKEIALLKNQKEKTIEHIMTLQMYDEHLNRKIAKAEDVKSYFITKGQTSEDAFHFTLKDEIEKAEEFHNEIKKQVNVSQISPQKEMTETQLISQWVESSIIRAQMFLNKASIEEKLKKVTAIKSTKNLGKYLSRMRESGKLIAYIVNDAQKNMYYGVPEWEGHSEKLRDIITEWKEKTGFNVTIKLVK